MHGYFFRFTLLLQVMQTWEILCWHREDVFTRQTWCISVFPFSGRSDAPLKQDVVCGKNHVCSIVRVIRYRCFIVWNQSSACVSAQKRVGLTCMRELGVLIIPCCLQICQVYECTFRVLDWYVLQRSVKTWPAYFSSEWQQQMLAFCLLYMLCEIAMSNSLHCGLLTLNCELHVCQCTAVFCARRRLAQFFIHVFI